jgi:glycosyltransferase involved in cell wall biosynthesis
MRILQVIHDFLPHHAAGSELYCYYLSKQLAKRHSVYLLFTEVDHAKPQYYYRRSSYMGIPLFEVIHNHHYRRFEDTYADPKMDQVFSKILDEVRPDVVHMQHLLNHSIGYIAIAKKRGIPVVFTLHDYWLSCPNGGQRIRPDLHVCDPIVLEDCADCIRKFGSAARLGSRVASKLLGLRGRANGASLLERLPGARVETPRKEFVRPARFALAGEAREVLVAHPPAQVGFDVEAPEGTRLRFGYGMAPDTFDKPGGGVAFEIRADGETVWEQRLDPKSRPEERCWFDGSVTLPAASGKKLRLELLTRPSPGPDNQHCTAGWTGLDVQQPPDAVPARLSGAKSLYRAMERLLAADPLSRRAVKVEQRLKRVLAACRDVDLFISPSPFLKQTLVEFGLPEERVLVSDNGMRTDLVQPFRRRPSERLRFGYVGTLAPHKGVHVLIEAFQKLLESGPRPRPELRVHGNLSWFPDYARRLQSQAQGDSVKFLGEFDNQDALEIYAGIDVLVVPSVWWENSPITMHEATLTGTPILTSDFGGMADLVRDGENGLQFQVGNAEDLRRKMARLLDEPGLVEQLGRPAIPVKTIEQDAADMEQRYLEVMKAPAVAQASTNSS